MSISSNLPPKFPRAIQKTSPDVATSVATSGTNVSRSARTRERILKTSLDLFNAHGESNVTTGHIADELNISPGNLYYHFRNKDEIIHHLFADFEKQIDVAPAGVADAASAMEDLWLYLHVMFERIWAYRFLYRNLDDLLTRDTKLKSHFNIIVTHKREAVIALCHSLVEAKAMRAADDEIKALAENVIVVASYWLNYEHLRARASEANDTEKHLTRGVYQVMALVAPFLIGDAREHLNYLKANYLE
jgi:AcrR family transcriptional regulator